MKRMITGALGLCVLGFAVLLVVVPPSEGQEAAGSSAESPSVLPLALTVNGGGAAEGVRETSQDSPFSTTAS